MRPLFASRYAPSVDSPLILVIGPAWVGDMVIANSLFQVLKSQDPVPGIQVLAPSWSRALLERMPEVELTIDLPIEHGELELRQRWEIASRLRGRGYTQAIVLPNSWKSALIPYWAGIPIRTGWRGEWRYGVLNDVRQLDVAAYPMTAQRFVALGLPADAPPPEMIPPPRLHITPEQVYQALHAIGLAGQRPRRLLLALCPGAEYGAAKRWPAEYFGELARYYDAQGWTVWLFGSPQDQAVCAEVNAAAGGICMDLSGRTYLDQAVDLLSLADAVVSNDSGLMHVAAALDVPVVGIFGSTDPTHTPPLNDSAQAISLDLPCSPCFQRECPAEHLDCLRHLSVAQVIDALKSVSE